jgi:hypothetical protein
MLLTIDGSDDDKIKPQGLTRPFKTMHVLTYSSDKLRSK